MKVQEISRAMQLQEWASQVNEQRQSGLSITEWCGIRGVKRKTFYYRRQKLREELLDSIESAASAKAPMEAIGGNAQCLPNPMPHATVLASGDQRQKDRPVFTALPMPQTKAPTITVKLGEYMVGIQNGADDIMVEHVLRMVARL